MVHFKTEYGNDIMSAITNEPRGKNDNLAVLGIMFEIQDEDNEGIFLFWQNIFPKDDSDLLGFKESNHNAANSRLVGNSNDPPQKYYILDVIKRLINQSRLVKTGQN